MLKLNIEKSSLTTKINKNYRYEDENYTGGIPAFMFLVK